MPIALDQSACGRPAAGADALPRRRALPEWGLLAAVGAATALPGLCQALGPMMELNRPAIANGQWWRLVTGSFVYHGWLHAATNWGSFVVLSWLVIRRKAPLLGLVMLSALAVGVGVYAFAGGITTYRGISGVNYALLTWLLVTTALQDAGWRRALAICLLVGLVAKTALLPAGSEVLLPGRRCAAPCEHDDGSGRCQFPE